MKLNANYWPPRDESVKGVRSTVRGLAGEPAKTDREAITRFIHVALDGEIPDPEALRAAASLLLEATSMLHYGHDTKPAFTARGFRKQSAAKKFRPELAMDPRSGFGQPEFFVVFMLEAGAIGYGECVKRLMHIALAPAGPRSAEEWVRAMRPAARRSVDHVLSLDDATFAEFCAQLSGPEDAALLCALVDARSKVQQVEPQ